MSVARLRTADSVRLRVRAMALTGKVPAMDFSCLRMSLSQAVRCELGFLAIMSPMVDTSNHEVSISSMIDLRGYRLPRTSAMLVQSSRSKSMVGDTGLEPVTP